MSLADQLIHAFKTDAQEGLRLAAEAVLEEAKRNIPVGDPSLDPDPNVTLREAGKIERTEFGWRIVFDTPYAARQEFAILKHPRGGSSHYLEHALETLAPTLERFVAAKVRGTHTQLRKP